MRDGDGMFLGSQICAHLLRHWEVLQCSSWNAGYSLPRLWKREEELLGAWKPHFRLFEVQE